MYNLKSQIFLSLTKVQKTALCRTLLSYAKKYFRKLSVDEIFGKFIEDETYYNEVQNPHFEWIIPFFENEEFLNELKLYLKECSKLLELKEAQKPYLEKQKDFAKQQRKILQEQKMAKQPPTKKQLCYYKKLCKNKGVEPVDERELSKLDFKNMISKMLEDKS